MHYLDLVRSAARRDPDRTAVVGDGHRLSFATLDDRIGRLGAGLRARGLRAGDRIALLARNELEYLEIQAACVRSGFTLVPLNNRLAGPEIEFILGDCEPALVIGGRDEHDRVARLAVPGAPPRIGLGAPSTLDGYDALLDLAPPDPDADPTDPALNTTILYTSGTTGRPKGAVVDRRGFTGRVFVNAIETEAAPRDVWQQSLPMFHIAGFLGYAFVFRGATAVMMPEFDPAGCLRLLGAEKVTATVLVPTMIRMLLESPAVADFDPAHLRLVIYGGAPIEPALLRAALARFGCGFEQQYGMTESGGQTMLRPADHDPDDDEALSSAGTEAASFDVRIVDEDDRPVPPGERGEIVCRGPAVMTGYWRRPDESAAALRGGWMHTGDIGYRDARGRLHVVDRRNDMIITGGENVYPREVEAVLATHPGITDAAVVGLPDERWGQVVVAVLAGTAPPDEELAAFLRERLAGYKVPRRWVRLDELPRNVTGKVLKNRLRDSLTTR